MKKELKNKFSMTMLSRSSNEAFARTAVASFVAQLDPTIDEINDIKTAVSEAVTNCIVHGYRDKIGKIYIDAAIYDDNTVKVRIRDKGVGIEDINMAMQPLYSSLGGERAGLGFSVMQSFTDDMSVRSKLGAGTTVILTKRISVRLSDATRQR